MRKKKDPRDSWPTRFTVMKGQFTAKDFDPIAYAKYIQLCNESHVKMHELIEELKKIDQDADATQDPLDK